MTFKNRINTIFFFYNCFRYENGGFESSFTPAQLQQIRRISLAQVLCRTLDSIDNIQPFAFLSHQNPDNERISCRIGQLNNFELSPWIEINSDSTNDVKKSDEVDPTTTKPRRTKPTTASLETTTRKSQKVSQGNRKKPNVVHESNKSQKTTQNLNETVTNDNDKGDKNTTDSKPNIILQAIDDKLDFRNKTRRYSDIDMRNRFNPNRQYNDYYDDVQNVQSVVINNTPNKRPSRPYISVTENIDKYTYLINYVPRPTQSWRQTTRRSHDRDVVKVTYQNYDDTYRRPNRPYYNRDDLDNDFESRDNKPNAPVTENFQSSARSNDDNTFDTNLKLSTEQTVITNKPKLQTNKTPVDKIDPTTENIYKLLTFGYVGTYRGDVTNNNGKNNTLNTDKDKKPDVISKDFSTVETKTYDDNVTDDLSNAKLSTFILYETATKPYNLHRPTRRNDDDHLTLDTRNKYFFMHNVLHKYPEGSSLKDFNKNKGEQKNDEVKAVSQSLDDLGIQERSGINKLPSNAAESKTVANERPKRKKPSTSVKTPSVAFQIIPSENK